MQISVRRLAKVLKKRLRADGMSKNAMKAFFKPFVGDNARRSCAIEPHDFPLTPARIAVRLAGVARNVPKPDDFGKSFIRVSGWPLRIERHELV